MSKQKILVLGAGKSGISCAKLLTLKGFEVFISDKLDKKELAQRVSQNFVFISEKEAALKVNDFSFAVKSPGIPNSNPLVLALKKKNIPVKSEVEVALSFSKTENVIMITGTNGKTTTTAICQLIMKKYLKGKAKVYACGNIGYPVSQAVVKAKRNDFLVVEVSSYQLEDSTNIRCKVCAILNIASDHIEHHGSFNSYLKAKAKIFANQNEEDFCILNHNDKKLLSLAKKCKSQVLFFSIKPFIGSGAFLQAEKIFFRIGGKEFRTLIPLSIKGLHNIENAMAAALCAIACKADIKSVRKAFSCFKGVEHRIEFVRQLKGVAYYNDSKATNVNSTLTALKALGKTKNIWLILGGKDKMAPYRPLVPFVRKYVKAILTVGEAAPLIEKDLGNTAKIIRCGNIFKACDTIKSKAKPGDIALLSPACASYDQFENFEQRGKKFKDYVISLKK